MPSVVVRSPSASIAAGAIYAYLAPRMAEDQQLHLERDLHAILAPMMGGKRFAIVKDDIARTIKAVTDGRLAMDANIEDVAAMLDAIERVVAEPGAAVPTGLGPENGEMTMTAPGEPAPAMTLSPPPPAVKPDPMIPPDDDDDPAARDNKTDLMTSIRDFVANHVDPEVLAQFDQLIGGGMAPPPDDPMAAAPPDGMSPATLPPENEEPSELDDDEEDPEMSKDTRGLPSPRGAMDSRYVTKVAMDAAIRAARADERRSQREIVAALEAVRPRVGRLTLAFDSAADVYRHALGAMGVKNLDRVKQPAAFQVMFEAIPRPTAPSRSAALAVDGLPENTPSFSERFKNIARVGLM